MEDGQMTRMRLGRTVGLLALGSFVGASPAWASLKMQKDAKAAGFAAANCQYCHVEKLPKKDAVTNNARGQWLVSEKDKRKAKEIDVNWLKDYVEKAEEKK
jgi:hypothetical protein